jgi:Polysulphide reductase
VITGKKLVKDNVIELLAKISGWMIITYTAAKLIDTIYWAAVTAPSMGFTIDHFFGTSIYGIWILGAELILGGIAPGLILISEKGRKSPFGLWVAVIFGVIGVSLNRWVMVLQTMAVPVLPFEEWYLYIPSWQEVATTVLPVAYGVILIMISYRYMPIFPQEPELNPID